VALDNQPKLVFELTGFDLIFEIFDTIADALDDTSIGVELPLGIPVPAPYPASAYS
jgi:hypothetical protein